MTSAHKLILIGNALGSAARHLGDRVACETDYDTLAVSNDQEAMEQSERRVPDVAILDMDLPPLDGLKAARRLRDRFGEQRPLLIAITGGSAAEVSFSGLFDHVLRKPVDMGELLPKLAQA